MVVSTQHAPDVSNREIREYVIEKVIKPILPEELVNGDITYHVNPTGRFVTGGPHGDCGLTGRKIIVDTYGGWARHGGGAFSGKDPTKVDRSAAYMARHVAKNIVAAGLADRCEVQLAYAIGVSDRGERAGRTPTAPARSPMSSFATSVCARSSPSRPAGSSSTWTLRRPIYGLTASGGHFGRSEPELTWEKTHRTAELLGSLRVGRRGEVTQRVLPRGPSAHVP